MERVRSPDGWEWTVRVKRVRLPAWPDSAYAPPEPEEMFDLLWVAFCYLVLAPIFWFVIPLARVAVAVPIALVRPLFSSIRWVEAECRSPGEVRICWETTRDRADAVAAAIAARLRSGYSELTPPGAILVSRTRPPGGGRPRVRR